MTGCGSRLHVDPALRNSPTSSFFLVYVQFPDMCSWLAKCMKTLPLPRFQLHIFPAKAYLQLIEDAPCAVALDLPAEEEARP